MTRFYYLDNAKKPNGPVTLEQLRKLASAGVVGPKTPIAQDGVSRWFPWAQVQAAFVGRDGESLEGVESLASSWDQVDFPMAFAPVPPPSASGASQVGKGPLSFPVATSRRRRSHHSAAAAAVRARAGRAGIVPFVVGFSLSVAQILMLPLAVLKLSGRDLARWGRLKRLPCEDSDLPVLTFLSIVLKPVAHFVVFLGGLGMGIFQLAVQREIVYASIILLCCYLGQIVLSILFESVAITIRIANHLKNLDERTLDSFQDVA